jgi:hypothetical protein
MQSGAFFLCAIRVKNGLDQSGKNKLMSVIHLSQRGVLFHRVFFTLCLIILALLLSGCGFNAIPVKEEQAKASWAEIQNQYQRRTDLVSNLVETVKGYLITYFTPLSLSYTEK